MRNFTRLVAFTTTPPVSEQRRGPKRTVRIASLPLGHPPNVTDAKRRRYFVAAAGRAYLASVSEHMEQLAAKQGQILHEVELKVNIGKHRRPIRFTEDILPDVTMLNLNAMTEGLRDQVIAYMLKNARDFPGIGQQDVYQRGWLRHYLCAHPYAALQVRRIPGFEHINCVVLDAHTAAGFTRLAYVTEGAAVGEMESYAADTINFTLPKLFDTSQLKVY